MGFTEKAGKHGRHQQGQQPRTINEDRGRQGNQGHKVLSDGEQLRKQADAPGGLPLRTLQLVIERRILEMTQIKSSSVRNEPFTDVIGAEVTQQTFDRS